MNSSPQHTKKVDHRLHPAGNNRTGIFIDKNDFSFFGGQYWDLNSGPHAWKQVLCCLGLSSSPVFVLGISQMESGNYLLGLPLNHDPPDLCLLSS
jgi:hypothetical protein